MPRYMVERTSHDRLHIPMTDEGAIACLGVVDRNADLGVTWVHSYVSEDKCQFTADIKRLQSLSL